jgi:hypothetical protein
VPHRTGALLTRWPRQRPPAEDVAVQMRNTLSGVHALIHDEAVAPLGETEFLRDLSHRIEKMAEFLCVGGSRVMDAVNVPLGDDERVHGRDRSNVFEREHLVVLEDDLRRRGPCDDVAK